MEMTNSRVIPASPAAVWTALNDPSILQASIPGCESLERIGDNEWRAVVAAKVGPVSAKFSGTMRMIDPTPPTGYTLQFTGQGGAAGFASGEARVTLTPAENGHTLLTYAVKAQVGGKLAQIGSRLIDGAAAKMADDFFARFSARLAPEAPEAGPGGKAMIPVRAGEAPMGSRWIRYVAIVAIAAILVYLTMRGMR
jgi:carbon monoxide dehydrogenase subunit G